ncbi:hypothetical protein AgCh_012427 [Apium graveolens]
MLVMLSAPGITKAGTIAKPGCQTQCGNVTVPYPFGIGVGSGCSINSSPWFDVTCNTSFNPHRAFLLKTDCEISFSYMRIPNVMARKCYTPTGDSNNSYSISANLLNSPFTFSYLNDFTVVGCDDRALITNPKKSITVVLVAVPNASTLRMFLIMVVTGLVVVDYAFLAEKDRFKFRGASDLSDPTFIERTIDSVPVLLDWVLGNQSCDGAQKSNGYACQSNTNCINSTNDLLGYTCECRQGFRGNPYLSPGCQDVDECANPNKKRCEKMCTNTIGGYYCSCPHGYYGNGRVNSEGCIAVKSKFPAIKFSLASMPIIHRDVKSANILLDENYSTKISDFGASRLIAMDMTQVTTLVQGTLGYLDPDFGAAELFTGRKPLLLEGPADEKNLATFFITSVKENRLLQILEPGVVREGSSDQLEALGELVKNCLSLRGEERPSMKEVAIQLEGIRKYTQHSRVDDNQHEEEASTSHGAGQSSHLYGFSIDPWDFSGKDSMD